MKAQTCRNEKIKRNISKPLFPCDIFFSPIVNSPHDCLELSADGAVDEEVDGGVDGEKEVVGAGQAEVPGGSDQKVTAPEN